MKKYTNDQLSEILPAHHTFKMSDGWTAEVKFNFRTVKVGFQNKPYYDYFRVYQQATERQARQSILNYLIRKKIITI